MCDNVHSVAVGVGGCVFVGEERKRTELSMGGWAKGKERSNISLTGVLQETGEPNGACILNTHLPSIIAFAVGVWRVGVGV